MIESVPLRDVLLELTPPVQLSAATLGMLGVFCSVMVYVATKRAQWSGARTGVKFFGTTALLGAAAVHTVAELSESATSETATDALLWLVVGSAFVKLAFEAMALLHVRERQHTVFKRMAKVMLGDLRPLTMLRFASGSLGGLLLPLLLLAAPPMTAELHNALVVLLLLFVLLGEGAERTLFFRAAPASRMPGGLR